MDSLPGRRVDFEALQVGATEFTHRPLHLADAQLDRGRQLRGADVAGVWLVERGEKGGAKKEVHAGASELGGAGALAMSLVIPEIRSYLELHEDSRHVVGKGQVEEAAIRLVPDRRRSLVDPQAERSRERCVAEQLAEHELVDDLLVPGSVEQETQAVRHGQTKPSKRPFDH